jgi:hypothetical protein
VGASAAAVAAAEGAESAERVAMAEVGRAGGAKAALCPAVPRKHLTCSGARTRRRARDTERSSGPWCLQAMLQRLQRLSWCRIDVSFQGARFGFAHNNIQVGLAAAWTAACVCVCTAPHYTTGRRSGSGGPRPPGLRLLLWALPGAHSSFPPGTLILAQVTRRFLNFEGISVARHLAAQVSCTTC